MFSAVPAAAPTGSVAEATRGWTLRPVASTDLRAMNALLMGLSPRSRRLRFHGAVNVLPCTALRDLSAPGDELHHTLVVEAQGADRPDGTPGAPRLVAEARWVREQRDATRAEFALSVADDWQRRGLARRLLERLLDSAARAGIELLFGSVLDENRPMLALLESLGARPMRDPRAAHGVVWGLATGCGDSRIGGWRSTMPTPAQAMRH